jgi:hypothetical protein
MERHALIFRLGVPDNTTVATDPSAHVTEVPFGEASGRIGHNIESTIESILNQGLTVTETGVDLLLLAAAVYAADKRLERTAISQDGWTREIDIHLPVHDSAIWAPLSKHIQNMLGFLTGDLWRFQFRNRPRRIPGNVSANLPLNAPDDICLFSGGLDSFIGAIDLLENGQTPFLISHGWDTADAGHQNDCGQVLLGQYGAQRIRHVHSNIGPKDFKITEKDESTQRSRSFLFFCIAAAAASGLTTPVQIVVPENGLIALNIPLDPLRLGAFSTRTTHPYVLARYNELLGALQMRAALVNPYRHQTKGEMALACQNTQLLNASISKTMSCSSEKKYRLQGKPWGHCGHCVPCIIRQAAVLKTGNADPTIYGIGNLQAKSHPSNTAEGEHIRSFQLAIHRLNRNPKAAHILVQKAGPLSDHPGELSAYADMYCRGLGEVEELLQGVQAVPK